MLCLPDYASDPPMRISLDTEPHSWARYRFADCLGMSRIDCALLTYVTTRKWTSGKPCKHGVQGFGLSIRACEKWTKEIDAAH